ncbi:MAG: HAD-IA family hydrolase [Burkholderiaceae bacterium]|nr:HAD-IA family hydrolase [Burkholderiaceae bacterium]
MSESEDVAETGEASPAIATGSRTTAALGVGSRAAVRAVGSRAAVRARAVRGFDALLLDFGSVVTYTAFERHRESERLLGLAQGTFAWLGPVDPTTDPLWRSMERGEISERDYWAHRASEVGSLLGQPAWTPLDFFQAVRGEDPNRSVRESARRTVRAARAAGLRVGILSNELELFWGRPFMARLDILRDVDALVDATHTGILKPDPRAYWLALEELDTSAERVLFVDDQMRNVEGARRLGITTVHFDVAAADACFAAVRGLLGLEPDAEGASGRHP